MRLYEFKPLPSDITAFPELDNVPRLCLHAKSLVIDGRIACIGSYNFDPRSANLNTETALLVWDKAFAGRLSESIGVDTRPGNSWVVWKQRRPAAVRAFAALFESLNAVVSGLTTIDLWPAHYTRCFELRPGAKPLPPGHPRFYDHYRAVGNFPGVNMRDGKRVYVGLFKTFGGVVTPVL